MNTDHRARHGRYVSLLWHCLWYGSIIRRFSIANTTPSQPHLRGIEPVGRSAVLFFGPPKMGGLWLPQPVATYSTPVASKSTALEKRTLLCRLEDSELRLSLGHSTKISRPRVPQFSVALVSDG